MTTNHSDFWQAFNNKDFDKASELFATITQNEQQSIFSELFQKTNFARLPDVISVLHRELHDDNSFDDFHKAWHPEDQFCKPIDQDGLHFARAYPVPTRVFNAVNMNNERDILSIGFNWWDNDEQAQALRDFAVPDNAINTSRRNNIAKVSDKKSTEVFFTKSQDDLGEPF